MTPLQAVDPTGTQRLSTHWDIPSQQPLPHSCAPGLQHVELPKHCCPGPQTVLPHANEPSGKHWELMHISSLPQQRAPPQHVWPASQHCAPHWLALLQQRWLLKQISLRAQHCCCSGGPH